MIVRELVEFLEGHCEEDEEVYLTDSFGFAVRVVTARRAVMDAGVVQKAGKWSTKTFDEDSYLQAENDYNGLRECLEAEEVPEEYIDMHLKVGPVLSAYPERTT